MAGQELVVWVSSEPVVNKPQALVAKHSKAWCLKFWPLYQRSAWSLQEIHETRDQYRSILNQDPFAHQNKTWIWLCGMFRFVPQTPDGLSLLSFSKWLLRFSGFRHEQKSLWCEPSQTMRSRGNVAQSMGTGTSSGGDPEESHTWDWIDEKHHLDENQSGEKLWVVLAAVYFCELSSVSSVGGVGLRAVILLLSPLYKVCGISIIFPLKIVKSPWRGMPRVPFGRPSVGVRRHFPLELLLWAVAFPAARELYHSVKRVRWRVSVEAGVSFGRSLANSGELAEFLRDLDNGPWPSKCIPFWSFFFK